MQNVDENAPPRACQTAADFYSPRPSVRTSRKDFGMQPLLEIALFSGAVVLSVLAAAALLKWRKESLAFAFAVESALLAGGAVWLRWLRLAEIFGRPLGRKATVGLVATWAVWGVLAAATVAAYANNNWDDADYCLSGLALRGYPVNYASSRPPFTHLVAALFADAPQFAGAALIVLLVALLSVWSIRRWGWTGAALPLALLATQNVFLERLFGFTSELPAAVLLLAAFLSLARERFALAGVLFACAGLARWNLSVIPLVLAGCVALRFGWKSALHFAAGGAAVAAVFLGLSFALVAHPIQRIIEGNLVPAYAWAEIGEAAPDLLSRSGFYLGHFFFLTPPAVLALAMSLCTWRRGAAGPAGDWCVRCAIPAGIAAYALAMLNIGGHFPRFMAPVVPLAFFTLADFLLAMPRAWRVAGACVAAAWGVWPADAVLSIQNKLTHRPVFSPAFCQAVAREVPSTADLCVPAIVPLSDCCGLPAMLELRRRLIFPQAAWDKNGGIFPSPDPAVAVRATLTAAPPAAYLIVPIGQQPLLPAGRILGKDARWLLWQSAPP